MKTLLKIVSAVIFPLLAVAVSRAADAAPVYELRTYYTHPGKMPDLLARFRDHTCKIFEKHGMVNVGYWLPVEQKDGDRLIYVLKHASREAATASWKAFGADPEWKAAQKASELAGPIVIRVESTFMALADFSPATAAPGAGAHVYELRIYTTNEGKLDTLDARFRDHTMELFKRHGMTNLLYWHPTDEAKGAGKTLIYLLAHPSREAATKSWADFRADPEWVKVKADSEKNGPLLVPAGPQSTFLNPTDFSALK